jgi:hypothetical protein
MSEFEYWKKFCKYLGLHIKKLKYINENVYIAFYKDNELTRCDEVLWTSKIKNWERKRFYESKPSITHSFEVTEYCDGCLAGYSNYNDKIIETTFQNVLFTSFCKLLKYQIKDNLELKKIQEKYKIWKINEDFC